MTSIAVALYLLTGVVVIALCGAKVRSHPRVVCEHHELLHTMTREQWDDATDKLAAQSVGWSVVTVVGWPFFVVAWFVFLRRQLEP